MTEPHILLNARIVETLYADSLVLSDEVRTAFAAGLPAEQDEDQIDLVRLAFSCEGLRTTTRMMHSVAWLLNQRAYFAGELSEFQLRRYGRLAATQPSDDAGLALLEPALQELILATERFHARLMRLDRGWRERDPHAPGPVDQLRRRFGLSA